MKTCYHCQLPIMQFGDLEYTAYNDGTYLHHRCIGPYLLEMEMQELNYEQDRAYEQAEHYRDDFGA